MSGLDAGVRTMAIAEANDGGIWAIQAKVYAETTFRLLIATTAAIGDNAKIAIFWQRRWLGISENSSTTGRNDRGRRAPGKSPTPA